MALKLPFIPLYCTMANITSFDTEIATKLNKMIVGLFNPNCSMDWNVRDLLGKAKKKKEIHDNALCMYEELLEA